VIWARLAQAISRGPGGAPEFADGAALDRRAALSQRSAGHLDATTAEWVARLNEAGVPCGPIYTMDQVFADPQVAHIGAAALVRHPRLGELRLVNQAARLSRTPATMARATPERGEHTDEILREAGYDDAAIAALRAKRVI
jgi:formyl-CoA transferase